MVSKMIGELWTLHPEGSISGVFAEAMQKWVSPA